MKVPLTYPSEQTEHWCPCPGPCWNGMDWNTGGQSFVTPYTCHRPAAYYSSAFGAKKHAYIGWATKNRDGQPPVCASLSYRTSCY